MDLIVSTMKKAFLFVLLAAALGISANTFAVELEGLPGSGCNEADMETVLGNSQDKLLTIDTDGDGIPDAPAGATTGS